VILNFKNEVGIQGGTSLRKEEGGRREN